ncbi:MAG: hypothetical protein AB1592_11815 [Pseudomonadota bacterium]
MRDLKNRRDDPEILHIRQAHAAISVQLALLRAYLRRKANFDPNQRRIPRGMRNGGRWTSQEGGQPQSAHPRGGAPKPRLSPPRDVAPLDASNPPPESPARLRPPAAPRPRPTFDVALPVLREPEATPQLLDSAPKVPGLPPDSRSDRLRLVRRIAVWVAATAARSNLDPRKLAIQLLLDSGEWIIREGWPYIAEYVAPPKPLESLQNDVRHPRPGTEVHHIVEQTAAMRSGFPRAQIDHPDNLVRISTLRHWEVTAWYQRRSDRFKGMTPRQYLQGKSWSEKYQVGLIALRERGILKP